MAGLPTKGEASTYDDVFVNRRTSNGDIYSHEGYSAALLPKSRWHVVRLGTRVLVGYKQRLVVVKINDRGAGNGKESRVLDLSRAAYAYLIGKAVGDVTRQNASVIQLTSIKLVSPDTNLGPYSLEARR